MTTNRLSYSGIDPVLKLALLIVIDDVLQRARFGPEPFMAVIRLVFALFMAYEAVKITVSAARYLCRRLSREDKEELAIIADEMSRYEEE